MRLAKYTTTAVNPYSYNVMPGMKRAAATLTGHEVPLGMNCLRRLAVEVSEREFDHNSIETVVGYLFPARPETEEDVDISNFEFVC